MHRTTIGVVLAIGAAGLVAAWIYTLAGSTRQVRALSVPAEPSTAPASAKAVPRSEPRPPPSPEETSPDRRLAQEPADAPLAADDVETTDTNVGPISGATFSELLDSGLVGEDDALAAEALRDALREAADSGAPE